MSTPREEVKVGMNRVLAARSLKYSEFRSQEGNRDARKNNVVVHKRDNQKGQAGSKMRSFSNKYSSSDNSRTPSVVAEILMVGQAQETAVERCVVAVGKRVRDSRSTRLGARGRSQ